MNPANGQKLRVIIVGAGFCGLTAAIELKLRGMEPIVLEAYHSTSGHGDMLDFFPNAGRVFNKWDNGKVAERLFAAGLNRVNHMEFHNQDNELLRREPWSPRSHLEGTFAGQRGKLHKIVYDYAAEINVTVRFNTKAIDYLDDDKERGVVTQSGEKILGDVVLAADGPRSLARSKLLNLPNTKVNSGYAIFRAYLDRVTDEMLENPLIAELANPERDIRRFWAGTDIHGLMNCWNYGRNMTWVLTHLDDADIGESWSFPAKKEDVYAYLEKAGFPKIWKDVVSLTPDNRIVDYKLVWRDPLTTWLSPSKRCAVMGDAAHCHLPTSAQGACQAVEDAATIAICLEKAQGDVPLALQVFERIRFNRSHTIHQGSISTRNIYHKNEWTPDFVAKNPDSLSLPLLDWIIGFDCQKNSEEHFDQLAADVRSGRKGTIEELALPAGGDYSQITIKKQPQVESLLNSEQAHLVVGVRS